MATEITPNMDTNQIVDIIIGYEMSHGHEKKIHLLDQIKRAFPLEKYKDLVNKILEKYKTT